jgi:hypothetical protein
MKHRVTKTLYDYWTGLRAGRTAPDRYEIEPGNIREILGDTFILEIQDRETAMFRLAGTRLCSAYCRELKGQNLYDFWTGRDREAVASMLAAVVEDGAAAVIGLAATNERGQDIATEMMFLPLRHDGSRHTRVLGCYATHDMPYWLGLQPVVEQPILSLRLIWPDERPAFLAAGGDSAQAVGQVFHMPRSNDAKRVGHLVVYDGGKA